MIKENIMKNYAVYLLTLHNRHFVKFLQIFVMFNNNTKYPQH